MEMLLERADVLRLYLQRRFEVFQIFHAIDSKHYKIGTSPSVGPVAQRLEQRTHNPLVPGSNPGGPTSIAKDLARFFVSGFFSIVGTFVGTLFDIRLE